MVNVTLGVFVESGTARIVLVDADPPNPVVDQTDLDLAAADSTPDTLVTTVLATAGALTESGHRLVGISLCGPAADRIGPVHDALTGSGLRPVTVVDESDAVTAVVRTLAGDETVATLVNDGATVALSMTEAGGVTTPVATEPIDGDPQAAYRTLVERFAADPGAASGLIVMGSLGDGGLPADLVETSPVPLRFPDDPEFMLARGAALASLSQDATMAAPVVADELPTTVTPLETADTMQSQQLAYSEVPDEDSDLLGFTDPVDTPGADGPAGGFDPEAEDAEDADAEDAVRRRQWLIGSSVGALAAVGFATLAVSVAITIEPTSSQQAVRLQEGPVPGKAFPVAPGQGVEPDGPNWTMIEHLPPPGAPAEVRTFETRALSSSRDVSKAAAPAIVNVYRDGTVAVRNAAAPLLPVGPAPALPGTVPVTVPGPVFAEWPEYVTRLIPDFSRIRPVDLLYFLANLRELLPPLEATTPDPDDGFDIGDIGVLAVVPRDQGVLFSADADAAGPEMIPARLFDPQTPAADKTQLLPPGTTVLDVPTDGDGDDPTAALTGEPTTGDTGESRSQRPGMDTEPAGTPEDSDSDSDAGDGSVVDETGVDETGPAPDSGPDSGPGSEPTEVTHPTPPAEPTVAPDEPTSRPSTSAPAPAPDPDTPTQAPAVQAPPASQEPATRAPATQAPATQAPATQAPGTQEPITQAPATEEPATQAPVTQGPATQAPRTVAPQTQAPETVAPQVEAPVTTMPQYPVGGGSFGGGADGD